MEWNADHWLQVAMELERQGKTFYQSLAVGCGHRDIAALATSLAETESEHILTFKRMRDALPADRRGPLMNEKELFAAAEELRRKILPNARTVREAVLQADLFKTLDMAIEMESDAVAFYSALAIELDEDKIDVLMAIVAEEREHLDRLQRVRTLLAAGSDNG